MRLVPGRSACDDDEVISRGFAVPSPERLLEPALGLPHVPGTVGRFLPMFVRGTPEPALATSHGHSSHAVRTYALGGSQPTFDSGTVVSSPRIFWNGGRFGKQTTG